MKAIIDRFEGDFAICELEDKSMINIEKDKLPNNAKEGSVLNVQGNNITFDETETKERNERIKKLMNSLWE